MFVHIPRTGGQSVENFFLKLLGLTWAERDQLLLRHNPDPAQGPDRLAHLTASEYVSCGHLSVPEFRLFYGFSFVRNPWDRIVSEYKYRALMEKFDFKSFLFKHLPAPSLTDEYRHVLPQYEYLFDKRGTPLVAYIGRFETLQADFDAVCRHLGIAASTLPRVNASIRHSPRRSRGVAPVGRSYIEFYDDESRQFVGELYKQDVEAFGYEF